MSSKGNQGKLLDDVLSSFSIQQAEEVYTGHSQGHGRIETRTCSIISSLKYIELKDKRANLQCIAKVESERIIKVTAEAEKDIRFYIYTLDCACQIAKAARSHWGIENRLHWVPDVAFREDTTTKRAGNEAQSNQ